MFFNIRLLYFQRWYHSKSKQYKNILKASCVFYNVYNLLEPSIYNLKKIVKFELLFSSWICTSWFIFNENCGSVIKILFVLQNISESCENLPLLKLWYLSTFSLRSKLLYYKVSCRFILAAFSCLYMNLSKETLANFYRARRKSWCTY